MGINNVAVAVIGAGPIAEQHIKAFNSLDGVSVSGIYSRTRSKAEVLAEKYNLAVAGSIDELYSMTNADIVVVAITITSVQKVVEKLVHHPWVALIEKPLGVNLAEAERIVKMLSARQSPTYVALNRRFLPSARKARSLLDQIDSRRVIVARDHQSVALARKFGHCNKTIENWMFANSIHIIDLVTYMARGAVIDVSCIKAGQLGNQSDRIMKIDFSSGDQALYLAFWEVPGPWQLSITTSDLFLELSPLEELYSKRVDDNKLSDLNQPPQHAGLKPGFREQAEAVVRSLSSPVSTNLVTAEDSLKAMALTHSIYFTNESSENDEVHSNLQRA